MGRVGRFSTHVGKRSFWQLWWEFLFLFVSVASLFAILYWLLERIFPAYFTFGNGKLTWAESFYFSFATQLTIGTNTSPEGAYRLIYIVQSIIGLGLFGIWSGLAVTSFMSAHPKTLRLASWAGYDLSMQRFFVVFVNQNVEKLIDVSITKIVKLENQNQLSADVSVPYIGHSLWVLHLDQVGIDQLTKIHLVAGDGIKFGISGKAGTHAFSNNRKYELSEIFVFDNCRFLQEGRFDNPRFDADFEDLLNLPPVNAIPIQEFDFHEYQDRILIQRVKEKQHKVRDEGEEQHALTADPNK